jgi:capsular polysaccharide biosynthesis protein
MVITVLMGLLLGCGAAFLLEMLDRRVRSPEDLVDMLQLPVLAVLEKPRKAPRFLRWRRPLALTFK